jgi:hypothetical protein
MIAQKLLEGELYVTNSMVAPVIALIRDGFAKALNAAYIRGAPASVINGINETITAFCERFGNDDSRVLPAVSIEETPGYRITTPFGEALQGQGRRPQGITIFQAIASFCDPRFRMAWLPKIERKVLQKIVEDFTLQLMINDELDEYCQPKRGASGRLPIPFVRQEPLLPRPPAAHNLQQPRRGPDDINPFYEDNANGDDEDLALIRIRRC